MDFLRASDIAHTHHPIAAPVSPAALSELVQRLEPVGPEAALLDLGCGYGRWLLEALATHPGTTGTGVDRTLPPGLTEAAAARGLTDRVRWVEADARDWDADGLFDVVLCVGATHAFGGLNGTLEAVRRLLRPGGRLLLGDGIWDAPPSPAALAALDAGVEDFLDLAGLVERVQAAGWEPGYGHVSSLAEWDAYEFSWTGSLASWALHDAPTEEERTEALTIARAHRSAWLRGWRRHLGFVTLVLHDLGEQPPAD
ncbi:SAM-dependent methyltransferase [Modestobacter italicus]|uniref:SAM-dependent methyltransferase n=1 Tax=Modestobacter italicus (strain DSM 44449 / CECT 9708 / BC 501) TaxID=2732864 RepID=UPI001C97048F|nr:class I SAM-dependent methyltransferase [Modestobacter italicus]